MSYNEKVMVWTVWNVNVCSGDVMTIVDRRDSKVRGENDGNLGNFKHLFSLVTTTFALQ